MEGQGLGRHRGRGPCPLSRSHVPIFGISGWAGLASPQIPEHIRGGGSGGAQRETEREKERERNRIAVCVCMREREGEERKDLKNRILGVCVSV